MGQEPHTGDSYDPRTWPEPGQFDLPRGGVPRGSGTARAWLWLASAVVLIGGAAASWLTRIPPGAAP